MTKPPQTLRGLVSSLRGECRALVVSRPFGPPGPLQGVNPSGLRAGDFLAVVVALHFVSFSSAAGCLL